VVAKKLRTIYVRNEYCSIVEEKEEEKAPSDSEIAAIESDNLTKIYHDDIRAVDGISFTVRSGEIFGLLGPNGAGKSTAIKMLVTLTKPTSGRLRVFGVDVLDSPEAVRNMLGYVPQTISADGDLSGYENLLVFAKLSYVGKKDRDERIRQALQYMELSDRADDLVKYYSGGMMRRLEIAQAIVNRPRVLLLDEPSIGLDPASRRQVWRIIKQLNHEFGTTILITTHDMTEADVLSDRIAIMSMGKIVATGTPSELKKTVGGDIITLHLLSELPPPTMIIPREIGKVIQTSDHRIQILSEDGEEAIPLITDYFRGQKVKIESISINKPSLDDVFMKYAKRRLDEEVSLHPTGAIRARRDIVRHAG
jgi:ABC-2 type transport system ATP-binding protein